MRAPQFAQPVEALRAHADRCDVLDWSGGELHCDLLDEMLGMRDECAAHDPIDWLFLLPGVADDAERSSGRFSQFMADVGHWGGVEIVMHPDIPLDCAGVWGKFESPGPYTYALLAEKTMLYESRLDPQAPDRLVVAVNVGVFTREHLFRREPARKRWWQSLWQFLMERSA